MPRILAASGGFLLAVLWMDLMFDVQVLASELGGAPMPESALASIAGYYRRVVTESALMRHFISFVIVVTVGGSLVQATRGGGARGGGSWRCYSAPVPPHWPPFGSSPTRLGSVPGRTRPRANPRWPPRSFTTTCCASSRSPRSWPSNACQIDPHTHRNKTRNQSSIPGLRR
jgi:hypothetical protein